MRNKALSQKIERAH